MIFALKAIYNMLCPEDEECRVYLGILVFFVSLIVTCGSIVYLAISRDPEFPPRSPRVYRTVRIDTKCVLCHNETYINYTVEE